MIIKINKKKNSRMPWDKKKNRNRKNIKEFIFLPNQRFPNFNVQQIHRNPMGQRNPNLWKMNDYIYILTIISVLLQVIYKSHFEKCYPKIE